MTRRPNNEPVGVVRICKRRYISCWIFGNREDYDFTVVEAIRLHPNEKIHAGWVYQGAQKQGVREDRTRYSPEMGRKDYQRGVPIVFTPDGLLDGKELT